MTRQCRFCGCTEARACATPTGPCGWLDETTCDAPVCRVAAIAELQLRFAIWRIALAGVLAEHDRPARWSQPIQLEA